jgi:hypothetical protein
MGMDNVLLQIGDPDNREMYTAFLAMLMNQTQTTVFTGERIRLDQMATMPYPEVETMAFQLSLQLHYLEELGFTLLFWQPSDILILQTPKQKLYILANLTQRVPLDRKKPTDLVLIYPTVFPLPKERCAPEVLKMNVLPFRTHCSASYYSLALLCLLYIALDEIKGSKLFYFLERCLQVEPNERTLLYALL